MLYTLYLNLADSWKSPTPPSDLFNLFLELIAIWNSGCRPSVVEQTFSFWNSAYSAECFFR